MRRFLFCFGFLLSLTATVQAADFSKWAVLVVSGDNHAHSGAPSAVFDNARHDLVAAFTRMGFAPANIAQFAVSPDPAAQHSSTPAIASTLWDLSSRAPDGCMIYFTSHGTPDGIVIDQSVLDPDRLGKIVGNACGAKPSVIVMSSCFSASSCPPWRAPTAWC